MSTPHPVYRPHLNAPKRVELARRAEVLRSMYSSKATPRQRGSEPPGPSIKPPGTVPPPQHDIMRRPVYVPRSEAPRRPGADDHYRFRSLTATDQAR